MSGVNKVILVGNVGRDPEVKNVKGLEIANFSLATSKSWKDESGEKKDKVEWHNIVCFKDKAALVANHVTKGRQIYIEGELQTRSWDDQSAGVKRYRTEIVAHHIEFLGKKESVTDSDNSVDVFSQDIPV